MVNNSHSRVPKVLKKSSNIKQRIQPYLEYENGHPRHKKVEKLMLDIIFYKRNTYVYGYIT